MDILFIGNIFVVVTVFLLTIIMCQKIKLSKLEDLISTDYLTGLLNRRGFEEALASRITMLRFVDQVEGNGRKNALDRLTVMFIDMDKFKLINDKLGHSHGDKALQEVANVLTSSLRPYDKIARIGGDEFAVIMQDTEDYDTKVLAKRIRKQVNSLNIGLPGLPSVSIGIASAEDQAEAKNLKERADKALYGVKENGRNDIGFAPKRQVCIV